MRGKKENLVDRRFGRLLVKAEGKNTKGIVVWKCLCACGGSATVDTWSLTSGATTSCGCLQKELLGNRRRKRPYEHLYNILCAKAARDGQQVSITFENFLDFTKIKKCHYCGRGLVWAKFSTENGITFPTAATNLDRMNSDDGYHSVNLVPCCPPCNRGKSSQFSYKEWVVMTTALKAYWKRQ